MIKNKLLLWFAASFLVLIVFSAGPALGWETDTHEKMNLSAIMMENGDWTDWGWGKFSLPRYYAEYYLECPWSMVQRWIQEGGAAEDDSARYLNHFHDPLKPWDQSGLRIMGLPIYPSSVVWAQLEREGQHQGDYSWHDAREYFYRALTGASKAERLKWYEKTFRALGQIMHLVEDAAVPDHTRNDIWHGPKAVLYDEVTFERWTDANLAAVMSLTVQTFNDRELQQIFGQKGDAEALIPISRLFDMNLYLPGNRPGIAGATIAGVAEYSNSNFLSGDTIFNGYEYPSLDSTEPIPEKKYLRKVRDGEVIEHLVKSGRLDQGETYTLDSTCYSDYASLLVPKAIAYASLVPYYFFRTFVVHKPSYCSCDERGCFGTAHPILYVYNTSSDTIIDGQLELYSAEGERRLLGTYPIGYLPPCTPNGEGYCTFYKTIEIGTAQDFFWDLVAVFRGTLGMEKGAVMVSYVQGGCMN